MLLIPKKISFKEFDFALNKVALDSIMLMAILNHIPLPSQILRI